jgi:hypothetical protein
LTRSASQKGRRDEHQLERNEEELRDSLTTQGRSAAPRSSCPPVVQAEDEEDGQGKKKKTKAVRWTAISG